MKKLHAIALATGMMIIGPIAFAETKEEHESHHPDGAVTAPAAAQQERSRTGFEARKVSS